jgi:hypothetical protein
MVNSMSESQDLRLFLMCSWNCSSCFPAVMPVAMVLTAHEPPVPAHSRPPGMTLCEYSVVSPRPSACHWRASPHWRSPGVGAGAAEGDLENDALGMLRRARALVHHLAFIWSCSAACSLVSTRHGPYKSCCQSRCLLNAAPSMRYSYSPSVMA